MNKLGRVIGDEEIESGFARHQQYLRLDGAKRSREIAVVKRIRADVAVKPGVSLRIQVRRAALRKPLGPIDADEGFEVGRAQHALVETGAVEILAQAPAGIDVAEGF